MSDRLDEDRLLQEDFTTLAALRWTVAGLVIVAAHGLLAWFALNREPDVDLPGEPPPAVLLDLTPLSVAPEIPTQEIAPGPQITEAQPETAPDPPDPPVEMPVETVQEKIEEALQPIEEPPPILFPNPEVEIAKLPELPRAEVVLPPPPSQPKPKPERTRPPKIREAERKKPVNPDKPKAVQSTAATSLPNPRADRTAAPSSGTASAPSISTASWRGALSAHLNRYKRYPPSAASTGTATVSFTINRAGAVIGARLVASSGDPALDAEAVSLPRRASPVPEPPANLGGSVTLSVPIRFSR